MKISNQLTSLTKVQPCQAAEFAFSTNQVAERALWNTCQIWNQPKTTLQTVTAMHNKVIISSPQRDTRFNMHKSHATVPSFIYNTVVLNNFRRRRQRWIELEPHIMAMSRTNPHQLWFTVLVTTTDKRLKSCLVGYMIFVCFSFYVYAWVFTVFSYLVFFR